MRHATLTAYNDGCRCDPCREHRARWQKRYRLHYDRGVRSTIPADRARQHLQSLLDGGMSWWGITKAGGWRSRNNVYRIWSGETARILPRTETRILAIGENSDMRGQIYVPAQRSRDRLRALTAIGWPYRTLADMLGMDHKAVANLRAGKSPRMRRATAIKIDDLFDRLWDTPGPSQRSRNTAARNGWLTPLALEPVDDTDLDAEGCPTCADITWLRDLGETDAAIAVRLGYSKRAAVADHLSRCARKAGAA